MVYVRELAPALHFYAGLLGFKEIEVYHNAYARLRPASGQGTIALHLIEPGKTCPPEMESVYISRSAVSTKSAGIWKPRARHSRSRRR